MQAIPAVKSKLIMPQLSGSFVTLERIKKLSKTMQNQSVVTITAPAGYGKTTLMVAALKMYGLNNRICWYRLEQADRDLAVFYTHFIEALFPAGEEKCNDVRNILANFGDLHSQYQYLNAIICQELWAFHNHHKSIKTFVVLDDFQQVKDSTEILGTIQYLINNLHENCSIFVSSRSETGILTVKQKLERSFLEVSREELCFSEEELIKLLNKTYEIKTDRKLIRKIIANTEGWAAGIIIMCQVLSKCSSQERGSLFEKSGDKDLLFKYFALEVLKITDPGLMLFLVKVVILREFTVAEASSILSVEKVPQLLAQCEKEGLFIQKIIGEVTTFRFHGLFREVLLQVQPEYLNEEELKSYHLKAAAYFIEQKVFDRAIEHFIACGSIIPAVELITRESVNLITFEAFDQLGVWFKLLPDDIVSNNGILLYIKTYLYLQDRDEEALTLMEKALSIFKENNDVIMQIKTLIFIIYVYICRNDVRNILKTLKLLPVISISLEDMPFRGIGTVIDLIRAFWEERFSTVLVLSRRSQSFSLDEDWKWMALTYSCQLHYLRGELNIAESFIKEAFEMDSIKRTEMLKGFALYFYSVVLFLKNDRTTFSLVKDELIGIGEKFNIKYMLAFGKRLSALERYGEHDLETALELLNSSTNHFAQLGNYAMHSLNILSRCLWLSRVRNPKVLLEEAKEAFRVLQSSRSGQCLYEIGQSIIGALAREAGEYEYAEQALLSSIKKSKSKKAKQVLCGSYFHLAKLYYDTGDKVKGEDALGQAFHCASSNGYVMFWDLHLPTLVEMSARCLKSNINIEYALKLIASYYGDATEFFKTSVAVTEESYLNDFCHAFISLYGIKNETFSTRINVCLLGKFSIAVNGVLIPENIWKTRKIEGVLKYLLLHRGKTITRENLMELFWPGSDKKAASMSLRAALYELRKVLKRYGMPAEGKDSIIHEKSSGLSVQVGGMLSVDADEFLSLHKEFKKLPSGESGRLQSIGILERMVAIYRGNLLEEELYEDWTFFEREEFKSIYLESALSLASIYVERRENEKAEKNLLKTFTLDPYNEEACFCLIQLYISTNQRGRAIKTYIDFEKRLKSELNIKPDEKIASIVRGIDQ